MTKDESGDNVLKIEGMQQSLFIKQKWKINHNSIISITVLYKNVRLIRIIWISVDRSEDLKYFVNSGLDTELLSTLICQTLFFVLNSKQQVLKTFLPCV